MDDTNNADGVAGDDNDNDDSDDDDDNGHDDGNGCSRFSSSGGSCSSRIMKTGRGSTNPIQG